MTVFYCINCVWYQGEGKCAAFPDGIPEKIKEGIEEHLEPKEGQKGDYVFTTPKEYQMKTIP